MLFKKSFSIIEMLTVVLIILLLMSLIVPVFVKAKMQARTSLCKGQLRQISVLMNSYMTDHGGYLPYKNANGSYSNDNGKSDIPKPATGNNEFYRNWNGHLLPYIDVFLPDGYTRYAMVTKIGSTRFTGSQLGSGVQNGPPADPLKNGWVVVDDAFRKGGYNDLKVFICPEIHQNVVDVKAMLTYNGVRIPRISQLCNQGFQDQSGYTYGMNGGLPTTYMANAIFFGQRGNVNSYRVDEISDFSKKALLLEGGCAMIDGSGGEPYYHIDWSWYYYPANFNGSDLASSGRIEKTGFRQKTNYAHDNYDQFWVMNSFVPGGYSFELASKFNNRFAGRAEMVAGDANAYNLDFAIVSFVDPYDNNGDCIYKDFLKANAPTATLKPFTAYIDEPNEYAYLTGNMNVLFGDGSVLTKSQGWLCNNRRYIALPSNE